MNIFYSSAYQHVVKDVIEQPHVENVVVALAEQVLVGRHVVSDEVVGLPTAEKRKSGPDLELDGVVKNPEGRGWDVANIVAVVGVSCWKQIYNWKNSSLISKKERTSVYTFVLSEDSHTELNFFKEFSIPDAGKTVLKLLTDETPEFSLWNS